MKVKRITVSQKTVPTPITMKTKKKRDEGKIAKNY